MAREGRLKKKKKVVEEVDFGVITGEARKQVWSAAVLYNFTFTLLKSYHHRNILAPRNGYLPLLEADIREHYSRVIPPNSDSMWHIPTGVLYDLLIAEFERPWNLTVHFRAYPTEVLTLCEAEAVKWNFINALKEASYIMYGSTKSVMNMSQLDQVELWRCVNKGELEGYDRIAARLRPGFGGGGNWVRDFLLTPSSDDGSGSPPQRAGSDTGRPNRVPVRVYVRTVDCDLDDLMDATPALSWDEVVYTTRPIDIRGGTILTVRDALLMMVPHLFSLPGSMEQTSFRKSGPSQRPNAESESKLSRDDGVSNDAAAAEEEEVSSPTSPEEETPSGLPNPVSSESGALDFEGIVRIQG